MRVPCAVEIDGPLCDVFDQVRIVVQEDLICIWRSITQNAIQIEVVRKRSETRKPKRHTANLDSLSRAIELMDSCSLEQGHISPVPDVPVSSHDECRRQSGKPRQQGFEHG